MSIPSLDDLRQIEELVGQFEAAWRRGERPRVEECVAGLPERLRALLVQQLVPLEIELRHGRGELTTDEEFRARLPDYVEAVGAVLGWTWGVTSDPDAPSTGKLEGLPPRRGHWPRLPGYLVLEAIGTGAMGVVYKAWQTRLGRNVAIKVIAPDAPKARFRREARLIARINSPHVVSVHDFVECDDGRGLLVMDFIDGFDLRTAMAAAGGRLAEGVALPMMQQVCEGMTAAAEVGIIHRDLKPANILVDRRRRALVADFGLAREDAGLSDLSRSDHLMGTPLYMAPEQAEDPRGVDERTDIYSFGATFYHALTGVPPFDGASPFAVLFKHKTEPLISPRSRNPEISGRTSELIERCLAKSPADRFPSFGDLSRQLHATSKVASPWIMAEDSMLEGYLERYRARRDAYLSGHPPLPPQGESYAFPRGRVIRILRGNLGDQRVDALVSSTTASLTMDYGVSLALRKAAGAMVEVEAARLARVRPGRAVVTSAGRLPARFIFHGVTMGYSNLQWILPSRDLLAEILASCFYHADSLQIRSIAFPLLGTGAGGFPMDVCLDTTFQHLARAFLHGLTCVEEARIVVFDGPPSGSQATIARPEATADPPDR